MRSQAGLGTVVRLLVAICGRGSGWDPGMVSSSRRAAHKIPPRSWRRPRKW